MTTIELESKIINRFVVTDKIKVLSKLEDCYLISEDKELDRQRLTIDEARGAAHIRAVGSHWKK
jgi:hypothetical protein